MIPYELAAESYLLLFDLSGVTETICVLDAALIYRIVIYFTEENSDKIIKD